MFYSDVLIIPARIPLRAGYVAAMRDVRRVILGQNLSGRK